MSNIFIIILVIITVGFIVTIEFLIRKGTLKRADTYSYKPVINTSLRAFYIVVIICLLVYFFSNSFEVTISLGSFLLFCIIAGCLKGLLLEYQIKQRGGRQVQ